MKYIWVVGCLVWFVLVEISVASGANKFSVCQYDCLQQSRLSNQWCLTQHRTRVMLCQKWAVTRYQTCSQQKIRSRLAFCESTYGERITQCVRWLQLRRQRCRERQQTCLKPSLLACRRLCPKDVAQRACWLSCQRNHARVCLSRFKTCLAGIKVWEQRCVAHARYRKQECSRGIAGTTHDCRVYGNRAAGVCMTDAGMRLRRCQQSMSARKTACLARCP